MKYCKNCGAELQDEDKVCPKCNTAVEETVEAVEVKETTTENTTENNTDAKDVEDNKAMGIIAYIGILCLIPLFAAKNSKFARFHTNQGLVLFIAEVIVGVLGAVLGLIPYAGAVFGVLCYLAELGLLAFSIFGIVYAAQGKMKDLPVVCQFKILK